MNIRDDPVTTAKFAARHWTAYGRIVYSRKPHLFSVRDVLRILHNLIVDGQLTYFDRTLILVELVAAGALEAVEALLDVLAKIIGENHNIGVIIAGWVVNLGIAEINEYLMAWANARRGS
jgi:hypothetical protein